jgi:hypothetical protein
MGVCISSHQGDLDFMLAFVEQQQEAVLWKERDLKSGDMEFFIAIYLQTV